MARKLVPLLVIASFALLVFAFAGCGGDDNSASGDTTATETTTTEETTTETETTETETTETETETTEDTDTTEASGDDFASSENCQEFAQIGAKVSGALTGTVDPDQIKSAFDELAAAAPSDIKGDFETLADYMAKVADALQGVDLSSGQTPSPQALAKLQAIDAKAATAAGTRISTWVTKNCTGATGP